jgi:ferredoxin-NADP reductase
MRPTEWRRATVERIRPETPRAATLTLAVPGWEGHRAGQHLDVRLTAEDGYQAQRRYSIASAPGDGPPQITVVEVDGGEVSPWMVSIAREEDVFEVRGPFGGWFVWDPPGDGEILMIGGGSGLVPLMSMVRAGAPGRLLVSARERDDVLYLDELERRGYDLTLTYTRRPPLDWTGFTRRVDRAMLWQWQPRVGPRVYVCGPTAFVESVADDLVFLGHDPANIRTERFG